LGIESGDAGWYEGSDSIAGAARPDRDAGGGGMDCWAGAAGILIGVGSVEEGPVEGGLCADGGEELKSAPTVDAGGGGKRLDSELASG